MTKERLTLIFLLSFILIPISFFILLLWIMFFDIEYCSTDDNCNLAPSKKRIIGNWYYGHYLD